MDTYAPFGLRPAFSQSGILRPAPQGPQIQTGYATSIYQNSPVAVSAAGFLTVAAAGSHALGVFQGVEYLDQFRKPTYLNQWVASTAATEVISYYTLDPNMVYEIQADDTLDISSIGQEYDWTALSGNATTGISSVGLDASTAAANAGLRVIGLAQYPGNDWGDDFPIVLVQISEHQYVADAASV